MPCRNDNSRSETKSPDPTKYSLSFDSLVELVEQTMDRTGGEDEKLRIWCERFVKRWHWRGRSREDCEDIVQGALAETYEQAAAANLGAAGFAACLRRSLEKLKKRGQREQGRGVLTLVEDQVQGSEDDILNKVDLKRAITVLFEALEFALPRLPERAYELVVQYYQLQAYFSLKPAVETSLSRGAHRKAVYRARRSLRESLSQRIEKLACERVIDDSLLALIRKIIQGDVLLDAFQYMEARDRAEEPGDSSAAFAPATMIDSPSMAPILGS